MAKAKKPKKVAKKKSSPKKERASFMVAMPDLPRKETSHTFPLNKLVIDSRASHMDDDEGTLYINLANNSINYPLVILKNACAGYIVFDTATNLIYQPMEIVSKVYALVSSPINNPFMVKAKFKMSNGPEGHLVGDKSGNILFRQVTGKLEYKEFTKSKKKKSKTTLDRLIIPSQPYLVWSN